MMLAVAGEARGEGVLRLATTTSLENSGLLGYLLPAFEAECECAVQVIPVGTGRALELGRRGDVDALLVHAPEAEAEFVRQGYGEARVPVAYNYFVLLAPPDDAANVAAASDVLDALGRIAAARAKFLSRGDDSGTHKKEVALWARMPATVAFSPDWYVEAGGGMGQAILMADELGAYVLSDSGTYLHLRERVRLRPVPPLTRSALLYNPYSVIGVSAGRHPHVNAGLARRFAVWLRSSAVRRRIADYRLYGESLFMTDVLEGSE